jgi:hypothetical protein
MRLPISPSRSGLLLLITLLGSAPAWPQTPPVPAVPAASPSKGDLVPAFDTQSIDGRAQRLAFPKGSKTVLLFFLSSCPTCHKMIPEWNRAFERRPKGLTVVGVIMDQESPGFWSTIAIQFPVVRSPGRDFLRSLNVHRAPLTLRLGEGGKVEDLGLGMLDPIRLGELFRP